MNDKTEQEENSSLHPDMGDGIFLKGKDLLNFSQMDKPLLKSGPIEESSKGITTEFIDSENRPITMKQWPSGQFVWLRAYDTDKTQVPETPNSGQAGLMNMMVETDQATGDKKLRIGDILVPDSYRSSGIGKKMLDQSIPIGRELGVKQIYGVIDDQNARQFWEHMEKYGWKIDSQKGAYGQAFFTIPQAEPIENENKFTAPRIDNVEPIIHFKKTETRFVDSMNTVEVEQVAQNPEQNLSSPLFSDKVKKALVGLSILATLTSSGKALYEYRNNQIILPESSNEIMLDQQKQESAISNISELPPAEYKLAETPEIEDVVAITEKVSSPAAEILDQKNTEDKLDLGVKPDNATYWYDVPEYRQPDSISCTPTSVSMVLGYWNKIDSKYSARTPKELYKENIDEKKVSSSGMVISDLDDEVQALNYSSKTVIDASRSDLESALAQGPVIALVKFSNGGLDSHGVNHAVVVSGMTTDNQVRITDPMLGKTRLYTWAQFDSSWGSNWGTNATRYFTSIRPSELVDSKEL